MDRRLTREALRLMEEHQPFVRATVVKTVGSVTGQARRLDDYSRRRYLSRYGRRRRA